ncbi:MAG: hypothetical protein HKN42_18065 [Granulosicoccus sp.]|nr:hypothetical protein [Granulosicoccus sp.]
MSLVCISTALAAESRPFIDALNLRHVHTRGIRLYAGDGFLLLQTGLGKLQAASAMAALLHSRPDVGAVLNAGVCGSAAEIGSVHLAHEVVDVATGRRWFPHLPPQRHAGQLPSCAVHTCDNVDISYRDGVLFDMEAAGIAMAASTYLSSDAIQYVKVVSDNSSATLAAFEPARASELMSACLPAVMTLCDWFRQNHLADDSARIIESCSRDILGKVRHSVSDTRQLQRLLQRHLSLAGRAPDISTLQRLGSARQVRARLQQAVQAITLRYEP